MSAIAFEILFILLLIVANAVFAMSEMAVVSARKARLQQLAEAGDESARAALALANSPDRFLSTVQIGITLVGILAGAFAGATLAEQIGLLFNNIPALAPYSTAIGFGLVVAAITYLSLVIGELVPKRIALGNAERIASFVARPMNFISWAATPFVWLLSFSTETIFKILRITPSNEPPVTEEEIKVLIQQGTQAGVFDETEEDLVKRVFRLGDRKVGALMTPRPNIVWLNADAPEVEIARTIRESRFSRFPLYRENFDNIVGFIKAKEYLAGKLSDPNASLESFLRQPLFVPETTTALHVLELFKNAGTHLAVVIDEYGAAKGLVTTNDFLEAIAGEVADLHSNEGWIVKREDGSFLVDAAIPIDDFLEFFALKRDEDDDGDYETLAGFILGYFGRVPSAADSFLWRDLRFEVIDMDGRRIDKVLVSYTENVQESNVDSST